MKKRVAAAIAVVLSLSVIAFAGCGGDDDNGQAERFRELKAQAESSLAAADQAWEGLHAEIERVAEIQTRAMTAAVAGDTGAYTVEEVTGLADTTAGLASRIDEVKALYEELIVPEMRELGGLEAYVEYGEAMLAVLDLNEIAVELGKAFLVQVEPALVSGDTAAVNAVVQQNMTQVADIQAARRDAADALAEAEEMKHRQRLGE